MCGPSRTEQVWNVAGLGPVEWPGLSTAEQKLSPDLQAAVGPGSEAPDELPVASSSTSSPTATTSADAGTTNGYITLSGTSMAAPHVARLASRLIQHYPVFYGRPYLLRSHLMATAILHDDVRPVTQVGLRATREDGIVHDFGTASELTLGDVRAGDARSAVWTFRLTTPGTKAFTSGPAPADRRPRDQRAGRGLPGCS